MFYENEQVVVTLNGEEYYGAIISKVPPEEVQGRDCYNIFFDDYTKRKMIETARHKSYGVSVRNHDFTGNIIIIWEKFMSKTEGDMEEYKRKPKRYREVSS